MGVSLVASIGSMMGVFNTPPEKTGQKLFWWTAFNLAQSATLAPLFFFSPALLARAGLYTAGLVGSLCYVGATARSDKYMYIGGVSIFIWFTFGLSSHSLYNYQDLSSLDFV